MKNSDGPNLSWRKADYLEAKIELPDALLNDEIHTEGELMTEAEIIEWIDDTEKTFLIIKEQDPKTFEKLYQKYVIDIHYLCEIGKITESDADEFLRIERFEV